MITIVNYGMGNLGSIVSMCKRLKIDSRITSDLKEISHATKILLPGVGAFDTAMSKIIETGLKEVLDHKALIEKIPVLGICLGMQLLTSSSEEGQLPGFGWIPAKTIRFPKGNGLKVPHMGWNLVKNVNSSPLTKGLEEESWFYFVHSFFVKADELSDVLMQTTYGIDFDSIIARDNIYGAQFHPEKSHKFGMKLLSNFAEL